MAIFQARSLKRDRIIRKLCIIIVLSVTLYIFLTKISWITNGKETNLDTPQKDDGIFPDFHHANNHQYHGKPPSGKHGSSDIDVALPKNAILEALRKSQLSDKSELQKLGSNNPVMLEQLNQNSGKNKDTRSGQNTLNNQETPQFDNPPKTMTLGESSVYSMSSDDEYLPSTDPKDPNEKFISYLPHSGFHNQRTALVNALFVAKNLGRTLLVPPVVLGDSVGWKEFDELLATYQNTDKSELSECKEHLQTYYSGEQERENLPDKCQASYKYTSLRWDRMFNMTRIKQTIAVRYRDDYKDSTLENAFGISSSDTYFVKDSVLYDYSITDKPDWPLPQKYQRTIYLGDLGSRRERLISFGSMFGSGRVQVSNPESISLQQFLANQFILSRETLPELFQEADAIIRQLGGPKTYMSIHARVGESIFEHMSSQTMTKLWKDLQKYAPFVQSRAPRDEPIIPGTSFLDRTTCFAPPTDPSAMAVDWSTRQVASGRPLVFFMATDATDPRHHPLFQSIYNGFTCVVTLADVFDYRTSSLHNLVNPFDGLRYGRFLVPLLDGLVASRAQEFTGSSWSTFGFYIRFLHDTFILSQVS